MSEPPQRPRYRRMRAIFLRGLGVVFLAAFASLAVQVDGLIGSRGILPAAEFLDEVGPVLGNRRYGRLPTVLWLGCSDRALHLLCWGGVAVSALLVAGVLPRVCLMVLWLGYLSLRGRRSAVPGLSVGHAPARGGAPGDPVRPLEPLAGVGAARAVAGGRLADPLAGLPAHVRVGGGEADQRRPNLAGLGCAPVPLRDATPADLDELVHAPAPALVPGAVDWRDVLGRADRPVVRLRTATAADGRILEPRAPPGADRGDRELRLLQRAQPWCSACRWWRTRTGAGSAPTPSAPSRPRAGGGGSIPVGVAGAVIVVVTTMQGLDRTGPTVIFPAPLEALREWVEPFHSMNSYGLFAVMTTERPEIIVEGSDDGETWVPYVFRWKPGDVDRRPRFTTPHMPRLDWQMWFAALEERLQLAALVSRLRAAAPRRIARRAAASPGRPLPRPPAALFAGPAPLSTTSPAAARRRGGSGTRPGCTAPPRGDCC